MPSARATTARQTSGESIGATDFQDGEALIVGQWRQHHLTRVRAAEPGGVIARPIGGNQHDPIPGQRLGQRRDDFLGRRVDPLKIFDGDHEGSTLAPGHGELSKQRHDAGAHRLGRERPDGLRPVPIAEEMQQIRRPRGRLQPKRREPGCQLLGHHVDGV
jgi:hypothetical protein